MVEFQRLLNRYGAKLKDDGVIGSKTLTAANVFIKKELEKRKFVLPSTGLIFLRTDLKLTNTFDDYCVRVNNGIIDMIVPCSTTAGDHWLFNPISYGGVTGTAVAKEQQIIGSHVFTTSSNWKSLWLGAPYFQQVKPMIIFRDGNKDRNLDKGVTQTGLFGINLHRAGLGSVVDRWSAGCQVVPDKFWYSVINIFSNGKAYDFTLLEV
jgi:hypothetical protein